MPEIKILYISNACPEEAFQRIFTGKKKPSQAAQKYHTLQIRGLQENGQDVTALCVPPISRGTYRKCFFRYKDHAEGYLFAPMINIPILRNLWMFLYVFCFTFKRTLGRKPVAVICDVLNTTMSMGALLAGCLTRTQIVGIVTDVPTKRAFEVKNPLKKWISRFSYFVLGRFHKYIFLTPAMNELINRKNRPYLISEGHVDSRAAFTTDTPAQKYDKKVCLYAGSLRKIYGIPYLVEAFLQANVDNSELHIYGAGEYETELRELSAQHSSIRFFGLRPNGEIVEAERKATLLINPRPAGEEYTKYSFPSKNMEYMVSGTPVLTTKLPGMPPEYENYVFLIPEETPQALGETLRELLQRPSQDLFAMGQRAKKFVLEEKSNLKQAARICSLLEVEG